MSIGQYLNQVVSWLKPDNPGEMPVTASVSKALVGHQRFSELLSYRDVDDDRSLVYLDDGTPAVGFMLQLAPLLVAGSSAEPALEAVIKACPADAVIQYGVLSMPQVGSFLDQWCQARVQKCQHPLLTQMAQRRAAFMKLTATGPSLLPSTRLHPRQQYYFLSVRAPYKGAPGNDKDFDLFIEDMVELRNSVRGSLKSTRMDSLVLGADEIKFFLREILNPHLTPEERLFKQVGTPFLNRDLVDRNTRISVEKGGRLSFARGDEKPEVVVVPMTVDLFPSETHLESTCRVLGAPESYDDRIAFPYYAYTTVHVLDREKSKDEMTMKLGILNRQTLSGSEWYRSMMSHLYRRRDHLAALDGLVQKEHRLVRAYNGINLYCHPDEARQAADYVRGLWTQSNFRLEIEPHLALPAFMASLPLQYSPAMDPPNKGMQRAQLCSSLNGAALSLVQGDWAGTGPSRGGPLLVSRRGQLASLDLLKTTTNFNFVTVATSGAGKSVFTNEIASDFLARGGLVRIIDVGRSYMRYCERNDGINMVFDPANPQSMNPLWGIENEEQLNELMPLMQDLLRQMAYPLRADAPDWEYSLIPKAVENAWRAHGPQTEMRHVYEWLKAHPDPRAKDLADQLATYAIGRLSRWFNGPRTMSFEGPLVVLELEELNSDKELRSVVLALAIQAITRELYLADRGIPKLLVIDEAWDLLGGVSTGKFIETAFRRIRKYNGIAGIITQSFSDFERTPAAKAALENAAWQFLLFQKPESITAAIRNEWIPEGGYEEKLLRSVRPGDGFSEVLVRGEAGIGLYRLVLDRHSYYTFTTTATEITAINNLVKAGNTMAQAIDVLAHRDYAAQYGTAVADYLCGRGALPSEYAAN